MKKDIDSLMQARNLDALLVTGPGQHNPAMVYLTGGAHLTHAILVKKRGEAAQLFYQSMERDEAAKTGLETRNLDDYRLDQLIEQADGDLLKALVARLRQILVDLDITSGRMAICGQADSGNAYAIFSALQTAMPKLTLVGEVADSALLAAMATKDDAEVERIRRMGRITTAVVNQTADFLTSHRVRNDVLVKADGAPMTIGEVKNHINLWLAERGAENPEGTIFAIGRDAGIPHSTGEPTDLLRLGQTIIFDIFPCEAGGGYFYDFTRTWCLGYATDEALAIYEDVLSAYHLIMGELQPGAPFKRYQQRVCDIFQDQGHPTIQANPKTLEGYVHSLGHGLGLHVHERPFARMTSSEGERLDPGVVVTIEPGLYYPDQGIGVRLEDTVWIRPDGRPEILADYPLDLILPVK